MIPLTVFVWAVFVGFLSVLAAWTSSSVAFGGAMLAAVFMIVAALDERGPR